MVSCFLITAATLLKKVCRRGSTVKSKGRKLATPKQVMKRSKESREAANGGFGSSEIASVVDDTPDKATKKDVMSSHVLEDGKNLVTICHQKVESFLGCIT